MKVFARSQSNGTLAVRVQTRGSWLSRFFAEAALLAMSAVALAQGPVSLNNVSYTSLPGDRVQVRLELSAPLAQDPLSFTIDNPARLALDFPGATVSLPHKTTAIGVGSAQSVTAVEAGGRARVVLNL